MPDDFDGFLKIDGVTSESKDPMHEEWIDIESFSFGCSVTDFAVGQDGKLVADDAHLEPMTFTGGMHKGSPTVFQFCVLGRQIPTVEFHARTAGGDTPHTFLEMKLWDCLITNVSEQTSAGALPTESITIVYRKISLTYTEQDTKTGGAATGGAVNIMYDQALGDLQLE
jgi:type VI secretion system secreted protein Hcp